MGIDSLDSHLENDSNYDHARLHGAVVEAHHLTAGNRGNTSPNRRDYRPNCLDWLPSGNRRVIVVP